MLLTIAPLDELKESDSSHLLQIGGVFGRVLEPLFLHRTVAPEGKEEVGGRSTGSRKAEQTLPHSMTFPISTV